MIDIRAVRYALLVSEYLSIRRAAAKLGMRPSTVSRRLRTLEDRVGFALFERSHAGAQPTDAGKQFLDRARHALAELEHAAFSAGNIRAEHVGTLSVAFYPSIVSGRLRRLFEEHRARFPELQVRFLEGAPSDQLSALRRRQVDVAFLVEVDVVPGVNSEVLWQEKVCIALPEQHGLAERDALTWMDLHEESFLVRAHASGPLVYTWLASKLDQGGLAPNIRQHDVSQEGLLGLVATGYGLAVVVESAIALAVPGVVYRSVLDKGATMSVHMAWLDGNENPALGRFLGHARRVARRFQ